MPRATNAPASRRRRRKVLTKARGFYGARHRLFRKATEAVDRAMQLATIHRKERKRDFRGLWIIRVNAACKLCGITYSRMIEGLRKADIRLNRKMLAEIAIHDAEGFAKIAEQAKTAQA